MKINGLLILTLAILISCGFFGDRVDNGKLPGRYVFQTWTKDTLDVYADGTYSHYKWWNGRKLENSGNWTYNSTMGEVDFDNFSFLTDSITIVDSTFISHGRWIARIKTENDEIRFVYALDVYKAYFLKVDSLTTKRIN